MSDTLEPETVVEPQPEKDNGEPGAPPEPIAGKVELPPAPESAPSPEAPVLASPDPADDAAVVRELQRLTRRSFMRAGAAVAAGIGGLYWLKSRAGSDGIGWPFRRILEWNEGVAQAGFSNDHQAPNFTPEQARTPRPNGDVGLETALELAAWHLIVTGLDAQALAAQPADKRTTTQEPGLRLTMADLHALPKTSHITEFKCVEGWSEVVGWAGVRFADFVRTFCGSAARRRYVHLQTPDGAYYVGLDMASALHPQTLLAYEMNGAPLSADHGAPLRLVIPVKYGIKNLKRIGSIRFTDERPTDYWAERGYDWYAGL